MFKYRIRPLLTVLSSLLLLAPAQPQTKEWTPDASINARIISEVAISPNNRQIAYIVKKPLLEDGHSEYDTQIWLADIRTKKSRQLTFSVANCHQPTFSPDGKYIAYLTDEEGKTEIWLLSLQGGAPHKLTETDFGVIAYAWSPKGNQIAYTTLDLLTLPERARLEEKRDSRALIADNRNAHLYTIDIEQDRNGIHRLQRLTAGFFHVSAAPQTRAPFSWAPEGKAIAFEHRPSPLLSDWINSDISVVKVSNNAISEIITWPGADGQPVYSPNGKWLAFASEGKNNTSGSASDIYIMPAKGGSKKKLAANQPNPIIMNWADNSNTIFFASRQSTANRLFRLPTNNTPATVYTKGNGTFSHFAVNGSSTGFVFESGDNAPELYFTSLSQNSPVKLTDFEADYPDLRMAKTEMISWYMEDSTIVEALLTYPVYREFDKLYPTLILLQDSPDKAFTDNFIASPDIFPLQALSQKGYAVLRINLSTVTNPMVGISRHAEEIIAAVNKVIGLGVAHPDSLAIAGWGYGGYLTALTLTKSNRFSAALVGGAMTLLQPNFTSSQNLHRPIEFLNSDNDNTSSYLELSPVLNVNKINTPVLVLHGENDRRVPLKQALDFFNELRKREITTEMVIFPRTESEVMEPKLIADGGERIINWLDKHVRRKKLLSQVTIK